MPATYYIHTGLQYKVGDHTTLHTHMVTRSCRSSAAQENFAGQRPAFYCCRLLIYVSMDICMDIPYPRQSCLARVGMVHRANQTSVSMTTVRQVWSIALKCETWYTPNGCSLAPLLSQQHLLLFRSFSQQLALAQHALYPYFLLGHSRQLTLA